VLDADMYDMKRPGITCMRGLRYDEVRGCTLDVGAGEAELRVKAADEMSSTFRLVRALYVLDGHLAHLWNDTGDVTAAAPAPREPAKVASPSPSGTGEVGPVESPASGSADEEKMGPGMVARTEPRRELPVFDIAVPPGPHVLQVLLRYQGNGYGVFSYLKGYKFDVRSSHSIVIAPGGLTELTVVGLEKGGVTTPLEERPAVRWVESR
jgi:hypothetical protein